MRIPAAAAALAVALSLLGAGAASAGKRHGAAGGLLASAPPIAWGVADDSSKYADDGGTWFYGELRGAGLSENRWTLAWDPTEPDTTIDELPFLERAAPKAEAAGVHVVLALYSKDAKVHDAARFCAWAANVAKTVQQWGIHDYIVWNEPNTRLYWDPQKNATGRDVAAPAYEHLLATCYDALHAADPQAEVIGMGLSPRASRKDSNEPITFLRDVGKAYRASGRTTPIMDQLSIHPYPNPNHPTDSPDVGYADPLRFGIPNLDRVKQAVYDAFHGTGQPTTLNGLTFRIDEVGWQVTTKGLPQYVNPENVATVTPLQQERYLETLVHSYFACDPTVTDVELFLLVDEAYRNGRDASGKVVGGGWQSGLLTAGGEGVSEPRPAYSALAPAFAAGRAACTGAPVDWVPNLPGPATALPALVGKTTGLTFRKGAQLQGVLTTIQRTLHLAPGLAHGKHPALKDVLGGTLADALSELGRLRTRVGVDVRVLRTGKPLTTARLRGLALQVSGIGKVRHAPPSAIVADATGTGRGRKLASPSLPNLSTPARKGHYALVVTLRGETHSSHTLAFAIALPPVD